MRNSRILLLEAALLAGVSAAQSTGLFGGNAPQPARARRPRIAVASEFADAQAAERAAWNAAVDEKKAEKRRAKLSRAAIARSQGAQS
jgi:hypothetical protein